MNFSKLMDGDYDDLIQVDETTHEILVMGRIGNAHWLEAEYGARKERHATRYYNSWREYTRYVVEVESDSAKERSLIARLEDAEDIWFEIQPKVTMEDE